MMKSIKKSALFFFLSSLMLGEGHSVCRQGDSATIGLNGSVSNVECSDEITGLMNSAYSELKKTVPQNDHSFDYLWNSNATTFKALNSIGWSDVLGKLTTWISEHNNDERFQNVVTKVQSTFDKLQNIYKTYFLEGNRNLIKSPNNTKLNSSMLSSRLSTSTKSSRSSITRSMIEFTVTTNSISVQTEDVVRISRREQELELEIKTLTESLNKQDNKTKESEKERALLESKIESLNTEKIQIKATLEAKMNALEEENKRLADLQKELQNEKIESKGALDKLQIEIAALETQLKNAKVFEEGQSNIHKKESEEKEILIRNKNETIKILSGEKAKLNFEQGNLQKKQKSLDAANAVLKKTEANLTKTIQELRNKSNISQSTIDALKNELKAANEAITKIQNESERRNEELRIKLLTLVKEGSLNAATDASVQIISEQGDLESAIGEVEKALNTNKAHLAQSAEEKKNLNLKITEKEKELIDLKDNLKNNENQLKIVNAASKKEILSLQEQVKQLTRSENELRNNQGKLEAQKQQVTEALQLVQKSEEELKNQLLSTKKQSENYEKEIIDLKKNTSLSETEKNKLIAELGDKKQAEQALRVSLQEALSSGEEAKNRIQSIEISMQRYTSQIQDLQLKNEKMSGDLTQERSAHQKTQIELQQEKEVSGLLKQQYADSKKELEKLQNERSDTEIKLLEINTKLLKKEITNTQADQLKQSLERQLEEISAQYKKASESSVSLGQALETEKEAHFRTREEYQTTKQERDMLSNVQNQKRQEFLKLLDVISKSTREDTTYKKLEEFLDRLKNMQNDFKFVDESAQNKFINVVIDVLHVYVNRAFDQFPNDKLIPKNKLDEMIRRITFGLNNEQLQAMINTSIEVINIEVEKHNAEAAKRLNQKNQDKLGKIRENLEKAEGLRTYLTNLRALAQEIEKCEQQGGQGNEKCLKFLKDFENSYVQMVEWVISYHKNLGIPVQSEFIDSIKKLSVPKEATVMDGKSEKNIFPLDFFKQAIQAYDAEVQNFKVKKEEHYRDEMTKTSQQAKRSSKTETLTTELKRLYEGLTADPENIAQSIANVRTVQHMYDMCNKHPQELKEYVLDVRTVFVDQYKKMLEQTRRFYSATQSPIPEEMVQDISNITVPEEIKGSITSEIEAFKHYIKQHNNNVRQINQNKEAYQDDKVKQAEVSGKEQALEKTLRQLGASFNENPVGFADSMANVQVAHSMYIMCTQHPELRKYLEPVISKFAEEYKGMLNQTLELYRANQSSIPENVVDDIKRIHVPEEIRGFVAQEVEAFSQYLQYHNKNIERTEEQKKEELMSSLKQQASQYVQAKSWQQLSEMMRSTDTLGDAYHNIHVIRQYIQHYGAQLNPEQVAEIKNYYHTCYLAMLEHFYNYYNGAKVPISELQALESYTGSDEDKESLIVLYQTLNQQGRVQQ